MQDKQSEIAYIKPGMAVGGATMADVALLHQFRELGLQPDIHVGYIDERIQFNLEREGFRVSINPVLDRNFAHGSLIEDVQYVRYSLNRIISRSQLTVISQSFLGDADAFNIALAEELSRRDSELSLLRNHDHVKQAQDFVTATNSPGVLNIPTTEALARWIKEVNKVATVEVLPLFVRTKDFFRKSDDVTAQEVREHLGLGERDFVIFQLSRIDPRKRVGKALHLSARLQKMMPDRNVVLLVAGGNEATDRDKAEKERLMGYAKELNFDRMFFFEWPDR